MRILLAALLAIGVAALAFGPERPALLAGLLVMLLVFLLGAAKLAADLIELSPRELGADVVALAAAGLALTQITTASRVAIGSLLGLALAAQALALALGRRADRVR